MRLYAAKNIFKRGFKFHKHIYMSYPEKNNLEDLKY